VRLLLVLCVLAGAAAYAAPCQPGLLSSYLGEGFTCDAGDFVIKSFTYQAPQGGTPASAVTVSPSDVPGMISFSFNGPFTAGLGQSSTYTLTYFIDPPRPIIHGESSVIEPGTLVTNLCSTAFPCQIGAFFTSLIVTPQKPTASTIFPQDLTMLGVQNILTVDAGDFVNGFGNTTLVIPEPAAFFLTAFGLVGLLVFRSRAKLREVLVHLRL
jgi:hypothetical protein